MALTDSEKSKVIRVLGWPGTTLVPGSINYSGITAGKLTNLTTDIESQAKALLARIDHLDTKLDAALDRALVTSIGDIQINPEEIPILRKERKRVLRELSALIDICLVGDGVNFIV